jgi:poly(3-hydroxybutyrate) depolymerase
MAWRLACERTQLFAAVALVAGGYPGVCAGERLPLVLFHGTKDERFPYEGKESLLPIRDFARSWAARESCRLADKGEVIFKEDDITGERWACDPLADVVLYSFEGAKESWSKLEGGGPFWPRQGTEERFAPRYAIDASETIWEFFEKHPKQN